MDKSKDEQERVLQLKRLFERKDMILQASKEIEDLRAEYIAKGKKDTDGRIESEVVKRLLVITSCLSEIGFSDFLQTIMEHIPHIALRIRQIQKTPVDHIADNEATVVFCAMANLWTFQWEPKKGPTINVSHIESFIKAHFGL